VYWLFPFSYTVYINSVSAYLFAYLLSLFWLHYILFDIFYVFALSLFYWSQLVWLCCSFDCVSGELSCIILVDNYTFLCYFCYSLFRLMLVISQNMSIALTWMVSFFIFIFLLLINYHLPGNDCNACTVVAVVMLKWVSLSNNWCVFHYWPKSCSSLLE